LVNAASLLVSALTGLLNYLSGTVVSFILAVAFSLNVSDR
jgi:hypothetical protein